jgi:hypothetical protein
MGGWTWRGHARMDFHAKKLGADPLTSLCGFDVSAEVPIYTCGGGSSAPGMYVAPVPSASSVEREHWHLVTLACVQSARLSTGYSAARGGLRS